MPELATPLANQLRVLEFGPRSVTPPPPAPADTSALAKAQVMGVLAKTLGDLPKDLLTNWQAGKKAGLQNQAIGELSDRIEDKNLEGMSFDSEGNIAFKPLSELEIALKNAQLAQSNALTERYKQLSIPEAKAVKASPYDQLLASFNPESAPADAAPADAGGLVIDEGSFNPEAMPEGGATAEPLPSQETRSVDEINAANSLNGIDVSPDAVSSAPSASPEASPTVPTVPTGPNIQKHPKMPNVWLDKSTGIASMLRDDGVILDMVPGANPRWEARKVTTKDAAATIKPTAEISKRVTQTVNAIQGLEELMTKRKSSPEIGAVEKGALVIQSKPAGGFFDSLKRQVAQSFVSDNALDFETARNRVNSLIIFAQGGASLTPTEKQALTIVEPDDSKDAAVKKMEVAIPIIRRELGSLTKQYPGYFPDAEKLVNESSAPAAAPAESAAPAAQSGDGTRANPAIVTTQDAYDALPSKAFFRDSSGKLKQKP